MIQAIVLLVLAIVCSNSVLVINASPPPKLKSPPMYIRFWSKKDYSGETFNEHVTANKCYQMPNSRLWESWRFDNNTLPDGQKAVRPMQLVFFPTTDCKGHPSGPFQRIFEHPGGNIIDWATPDLDKKTKPVLYKPKSMMPYWKPHIPTFYAAPLAR